MPSISIDSPVYENTFNKRVHTSAECYDIESPYGWFLFKIQVGKLDLEAMVWVKVSNSMKGSEHIINKFSYQWKIVNL